MLSTCPEAQCQTASPPALLPSCVLCYPFDSMLRQFRELSWYWKTIPFFSLLICVLLNRLTLRSNKCWGQHAGEQKVQPAEKTLLMVSLTFFTCSQHSASSEQILPVTFCVERDKIAPDKQGMCAFTDTIMLKVRKGTQGRT